MDVIQGSLLSSSINFSINNIFDMRSKYSLEELTAKRQTNGKHFFLKVEMEYTEIA